jgi:hypothetical protein
MKGCRKVGIFQISSSVFYTRDGIPTETQPRHTFRQKLFFLFSKKLKFKLTNNEEAIFHELVGRDLKVERGRAFPDSAGRVVVGAVAGAVVAAKVAGICDGNAALKNDEN